MSRILLGPLLVFVAVLILFGSALLGETRLAFRDVSHFYTPLYEYVAHRTSDQWLPLWNPLDQTGMPLMGETSTAVLYPIRYLVYAAPLTAEVAMTWYVVLHLILASLAAGWAAGRVLPKLDDQTVGDAGHGRTRWGPVAASIVYPLSGGVLFLYTNPPFLVGAAWLPFALGSLVTVKPMATVTRCLIAGPALAMMVLGGDPQTALHAVLIAIAVAVCRVIKNPPTFPFRSAVTATVASALIAAALAAPQLVASVSWSQQSDRVGRVEQNAWYQPPTVGSQRAESYQFSLAPWHVTEILTPRAFGSLFPQYKRISALIPGDGRIWTPTIYLGALSALALLARLVQIRTRGLDAWLMIGLFSLWLSMGHFGVVWLIQQVDVLANVDSAAGGPYWWLYQLVPGYDSFRYPTKWLPVFSLAVAVMTAQWFDELDLKRRGVPVYLWFVLVAALLAFIVLKTRLLHAFVPDVLPHDPYWGPLDVVGSLKDIRHSLVHSVIVVAAIIIAFLLPTRWQRATAMALVLLVDLGVHGNALVATSNVALERTRVADVDSTYSDGFRYMRTQTDGGWPKQWSRQRDRYRMLDVATAERAAWFGRWHLEQRVNVLNNMSSISSKEMSLFWAATEQIQRGRDDAGREKFWQATREWLAIDGISNTDSATAIRNFDFSGESIGGELLPTIRRKQAGARSDASHHANWIHDREGVNLDSMVNMVDDIVRSPDRAVLVGDAPYHQDGWISDDAVEFQMEVEFDQPTLVCRPTLQDGHWHAQLIGPSESRSALVHKVDHLKQGVIVPAGKWTLHFFYAPRWILPSMVLALSGWLALACTASWRTIRYGSMRTSIPLEV